MSLQAELDTYKAGFVKKVPPEALAVIQRATQELANSGQVEKAVKAGDRAPDFRLLNTADEAVGLADLLAKGPLVLTFYRGKW